MVNVTQKQIKEMYSYDQIVGAANKTEQVTKEFSVLYEDLESVLDEVNDWCKKEGISYKDFFFDTYVMCGDDTTVLTFKVKETIPDDVRYKRGLSILQERENKKARKRSNEERERAEYERLKAKYG